MSTLILAYTTWGAALLERAVLVTMLLGWVILLERGRKERRGVRNACRWALLALCCDRLIIEFRLWSPISCLLVGGWRVLARGRDGEGRRGRKRSALYVVLAAAVLAAAGARFPEMWIVRWLVCVWVFGALYARGRVRGEREEYGNSPSVLLAATTLFCSLDGLVRTTFVWLLLLGAAGWMGLGFVGWRRRRAKQSGERKAKRGRVPVALWIGSVLMAALVMELYFRHGYNASDANAQLRTWRHWYDRNVKLNSWGFRDQEFEPTNRYRGALRIALVGDSFAFGQGIRERDDLLNVQLERAIAERTGGQRPVRVFNLARWGIETPEETEIVREYGARLDPHVVVLVYCFNDIPDPFPLPHKGHLVLETYRPLMEASDFLEFFIWHFYVWKSAGPSGELTNYLSHYEHAETFEAHRLQLADWASAVRALGAEPVAVIFPFLGGTGDAQRRAASRVRDALGEMGVPTLDVGDVADLGDPRYRANAFDWHPGAALHAVVAPALAEVVLEAAAN